MLGRRFSLVGRFAAVIVFTMASHSQAGVINDFTGYYDASLWSIIAEGDGSVDISGAPSSIKLVGSDENSGNTRNVDFTRISPSDGLVSFAWSYSTEDTDGAEMDRFGFLLNGVFTALSTDELSGPTTDAGSFSIAVQENDLFGFRIASLDDLLGRAETTVSNFSGPAPLSSEVIPEPSTFALLGLVLAGVGVHRLRRRRAPDRCGLRI